MVTAFISHLAVKMLRECCVPGCNSNYALNGVISEYVPCFSFPKEQSLQKQWVQNIPRKYWTPSESAVVCIKHFDPDCLELEVSYKNTDGEAKTFPYHKPKLKAGSLPTIFDRLRAYLSEKTPVIRKNPEDIAMKFKDLRFKSNVSNNPKPRHRKRTLTGRREVIRKKLRRKILQGLIHFADRNGAKRKAEKVTVMCDPVCSQESLKMEDESEEHEAIPQVCIKQEVVVKEEVQDPLEYLEEFREEQPSWSENNFSSRENLTEGDSNALCEPVPQVWVKEEIEVKEEVQDPLEYSEETSEEQPSCSEFR